MAGGAGALRAVDFHSQFGVDNLSSFEDCWFDGMPGFNSGHLFIGLVSGAAPSDYTCGITVTGCRSIGNFVRVGLDGAALAFFGGGVAIDDCKVLNGAAVNVGASISTTIPCTINNSILMSAGGAALSANALGQLTEDTNDIWSVTPRTNVTAGGSSTANTKSRYAPLSDFVSDYQSFLNQITGTSASGGSAVDSLAGSLAGSLAR